MKRTPLLVFTLALGCGAAPLPAAEVARVEDGCAEGPEDVDGFQDDDGCADRDNDGDGVADASDACPCAPEDVDGVEDADGCPDPDNDHDCLHDACDTCPMEAEIYNGVEDEDGCPDRGRVLLLSEEIVILERVYFGPRAATLEPRSLPILEAVAATLVGNPQLREVVVAGRATRQEGERVARARAQAVMDFLVAHGVDAARLSLRTELEGSGAAARHVFFEITRVDAPPPRAPYATPVCTTVVACPAAPTINACDAPAAAGSDPAPVQ